MQLIAVLFFLVAGASASGLEMSGQLRHRLSTRVRGRVAAASNLGSAKGSPAPAPTPPPTSSSCSASFCGCTCVATLTDEQCIDAHSKAALAQATCAALPSSGVSKCGELENLAENLWSVKEVECDGILDIGSAPTEPPTVPPTGPPTLSSCSASFCGCTCVASLTDEQCADAHSKAALAQATCATLPSAGVSKCGELENLAENLWSVKEVECDGDLDTGSAPTVPPTAPPTGPPTLSGCSASFCGCTCVASLTSEQCVDAHSKAALAQATCATLPSAGITKCGELENLAETLWSASDVECDGSFLETTAPGGSPTAPPPTVPPTTKGSSTDPPTTRTSSPTMPPTTPVSSCSTSFCGCTCKSLLSGAQCTAARQQAAAAEVSGTCATLSQAGIKKCGELENQLTQFEGSQMACDGAFVSHAK